MGKGDKKLLDEVEKILERSKEEFSRGERNGDNITIRDAAEKAWNAVVKATDYLELEKAELSVRKKGVIDRYMAREQSLHEFCFHEGIYSIERIGKDLEKVKRYIDDVKELSG